MSNEYVSIEYVSPLAPDATKEQKSNEMLNIVRILRGTQATKMSFTFPWGDEFWNKDLLDAISKHEKLRRLQIIGGRGSGASGAEVVEGLKGLNHLEYIGIVACSFNFEEDLGNLQECFPKLTTVVLRDVGASCLSSILTLERLEFMNLFGAAIGDAGLNLIFEKAPMGLRTVVMSMASGDTEEHAVTPGSVNVLQYILSLQHLIILNLPRGFEYGKVVPRQGIVVKLSGGPPCPLGGLMDTHNEFCFGMP